MSDPMYLVNQSDIRIQCQIQCILLTVGHKDTVSDPMYLVKQSYITVSDPMYLVNQSVIRIQCQIQCILLTSLT